MVRVDSYRARVRSHIFLNLYTGQKTGMYFLATSIVNCRLVRRFLFPVIVVGIFREGLLSRVNYASALAFQL